MHRRDFLRRGLAAAIAAALYGVGGWRAGASAPSQEKRALASRAFRKLPIGSITPKGWLREQLRLQAEGLCGRMPEVSDYLKYEGNGWVTPGSNVGWEEVPYWLRGFGDLGYVLSDARIIALATKWIDGMIDSQQSDGWFGPANLRTSLDGGPDMWPHMPMLEALRSFYEYNRDPRVLQFMTRYFGFQKAVAETNPAQFGKSWAGVRWGNNLDSILWLYDRTGDDALLRLATTIHNHSADYVSNIPTWHNVNLAQGFREPAQFGLIARDTKYMAATEHVYETVMSMYGQFPGGGFAGDENCRVGYHDPRQGFETCGIVELMQSFEILTLISGDTKWADRTEDLAFNSLPAALDPQQKGTHYITSANSIRLDNAGKGHDFDNSWPMQVYEPGIHNYRCCPHNYGMGWPYYAEFLWLATPDNGLCASLYARSEVRAQVGHDQTVVHIVQDTDYPFSDTIQMTLTLAKPTQFPLHLRVPGWCQSPIVRVNGQTVAITKSEASYLIVQRTWQSGDKVTLHLPMQTTVRTWEQNANAVSVDHGPLTFSLQMNETWVQTAGTARWPEYEVHSDTAWNYGLALDAMHLERTVQLHRKAGALAANPFTHETCPLTLTASARKLPEWQAGSSGLVGFLLASPVPSSEPLETITLIPMGAARLRITAFPRTVKG